MTPDEHFKVRTFFALTGRLPDYEVERLRAAWEERFEKPITIWGRTPRMDYWSRCSNPNFACADAYFHESDDEPDFDPTRGNLR